MRKESKHISTKKSTEHKGRQQERKRGQKKQEGREQKDNNRVFLISNYV